MLIRAHEERHVASEEMSSTISEQGSPHNSVRRSNPDTRNNVRRKTITIDEKNTFYPNDVYSFLALNGPTIDAGCCCWSLQHFRFFIFGLMSFVFQIVMFGSLICPLAQDGTIGKGRPEDKRECPGCDLAVCQIVALVAYILFPNSGVMDMLNAIKLYPLSFSNTDDNPGNITTSVPIGCIRISCILRSIQAHWAISIFFFLIMSCDSIVDIILNFTAVNYISELDEVAFKLASAGVFGPSLASEARRIANTRLPACSYRASTHTWYAAVMAVYSILMLVVWVTMMVTEKFNEDWVRRSFIDPQLVGFSVLLVVTAYSSIKAYCNRKKSTESENCTHRGRELRLSV